MDVWWVCLVEQRQRGRLYTLSVVSCASQFWERQNIVFVLIVVVVIVLWMFVGPDRRWLFLSEIFCAGLSNLGIKLRV